jgi:hypothetical protein
MNTENPTAHAPLHRLVGLPCPYAIGNPLMYEDDLPEDMPDSDYAVWFAASKIISGVRMGPLYQPNARMSGLSAPSDS